MSSLFDLFIPRRKPDPLSQLRIPHYKEPAWHEMDVGDWDAPAIPKEAWPETMEDWQLSAKIDRCNQNLSDISDPDIYNFLHTLQSRSGMAIRSPLKSEDSFRDDLEEWAKSLNCSLGDLAGQIARSPRVCFADAHEMNRNYSNMFGDAETFKRVAVTILPSILSKKNSVTIWCAASSTGDDPQSLLLLIRNYFNNTHVTLVATDFDQHNIEECASRLAPRYRMTRPQKAGIRLFEDLMDLSIRHRDLPHRRTIEVRFHDLITPPPISNADLIFCRNALLHQSPLHQEATLRNLIKAGTEGTYVFFGTTTPLSVLQGHDLTTVDERLKIFQIKGK